MKYRCALLLFLVLAGYSAAWGQQSPADTLTADTTAIDSALLPAPVTELTAAIPPLHHHFRRFELMCYDSVSTDISHNPLQGQRLRANAKVFNRALGGPRKPAHGGSSISVANLHRCVLHTGHLASRRLCNKAPH